MITSKQRSFLRAMGNTLQPIFQIGKGGISDNMITQFNEALEARELIKITVLRNTDEDISTLSTEAAKATESDIVQVVGGKFLLYKESVNNKTIKLP